jgi:hypothetical protein
MTNAKMLLVAALALLPVNAHAAGPSELNLGDKAIAIVGSFGCQRVEDIERVRNLVVFDKDKASTMKASAMLWAIRAGCRFYNGEQGFIDDLKPRYLQACFRVHDEDCLWMADEFLRAVK